MSFDLNQRAVRANEILESKVDETNKLLRELIKETKAIREKVAPKQIDLAEARRIIDDHGKDDVDTDTWLKGLAGS